MTHEKYTGVTFNDLDSSKTQISRSSEFFIVNTTEIAPHKAHDRETTGKIIVYARNTGKWIITRQTRRSRHDRTVCIQNWI